jgi:hypothetical protein
MLDSEMVWPLSGSLSIYSSLIDSNREGRITATLLLPTLAFLLYGSSKVINRANGTLNTGKVIFLGLGEL